MARVDGEDTLVNWDAQGERSILPFPRLLELSRRVPGIEILIVGMMPNVQLKCAHISHSTPQHTARPRSSIGLLLRSAGKSQLASFCECRSLMALVVITGIPMFREATLRAKALIAVSTSARVSHPSLR